MSSKLTIAAAAAIALFGSTFAASAQYYRGYPGDTSSQGNVGPGTSNNGTFIAPPAYSDGPIYYTEPNYGYGYGSYANGANGWTSAKRGPNFYRLLER